MLTAFEKVHGCCGGPNLRRIGLGKCGRKKRENEGKDVDISLGRVRMMAEK
jgi:hypothetical protein